MIFEVVQNNSFEALYDYMKQFLGNWSDGGFETGRHNTLGKELVKYMIRTEEEAVPECC